ncbi:MAG: glycosyltransferase family 4 protein [Porticoccaceae bacterium]|nr:glycosyltransferase family 4 protein [Porticoccaceae bacterium]
MKVAFDNQAFNWQSYGGISRYYAILAEELLKQRLDVSVFAGIHQNNYLSALPNEVVSGIKLKKYPPKTSRLFQMFNHYAVNHQINRWQPDIIHETYYSSRLLPQKAVPRVATVYDMIHELYPKMFLARDKTSEWKRKTLDRVVHIISISHSTKKDLIDLFDVEESKISVVHLGVDVNLSLSGYPNEHECDAQPPFLLYVGERGAYKNFSGVLRAIANSQQLRNDFNLIAFGGGYFKGDELSLISNLGFKDNQVRQIDGGDDILASLYRQACAFVYPSLYEGFGLPPLEAMACSCPVISSNTSSMPEVIGEAGEYFNPIDIETMTIAIEKVVYSSVRTEELRALGQNRVKQFSWGKCADETLEVYKKIIG